MKPFWKVCTETVLKKFSKNIIKKMSCQDFLTIKNVFEKIGGSWKALFDGDVNQWLKLKKVCSRFVVIYREVNEKK